MINFNYKLFSILFLISGALFFTACGEASQGDKEITTSELTDGEETSSEANAARVQDIFYAVPSPMEMAAMLKKVGATYNASIINDVRNVHNYTTARSRALNLGIYGADLSYASVFNQNQEAIIYLSCTKKLADNLGVTKAFNDETIERMEANVDNRDSLLSIVSETYYILDSYLKENGRDHVSALVIAGGWVEGLYISTTVAGNDAKPSKELLERIADQKISLGNLQSLVKAYNKENQIDDIVADLEAIEKAFEGVSHEKGEASKDAGTTEVPVIGSKNTVTISQETFAEISRVVIEIRTRYIS